MNDVREIGRVEQVLGATVVIDLDGHMAGVSPILSGRVQPVGQIGSLVRIPQGPVNIVAAVTLVGVGEVPERVTGANASSARRWLQAQLLGEIVGTGPFRRGVSSYPTIGDPVLLVLDRELEAIFPPTDSRRVRIGTLSASRRSVVTLDVASLVARHGAIVGSTGSGKSTLVATLIQGIARQWPAANVLVVDPHGEYAHALAEFAVVRSVRDATGAKRLSVPYWALPAADILRLVGSPVEGGNTPARFAELVTEKRREFAATAKWTTPPLADISADTPVPFDLRAVWHRLDRENGATQRTIGGVVQEALIEEGDPSKLVRASFETYGPGGTPPNKAATFDNFKRTPERIRNRLLDSRLAFFLEPLAGSERDQDPLPGLVSSWLGDERAVSVLDLSGVPSEAADLAVGLITRTLFEVAVRGDGDGIGRARPVLIVLEEAHRYLGDEGTATRMARDAVNRIAREGRKHGIGLLLVTQRPSELPATALSQVGTVCALRLTNGVDQGQVRATLPDSLAGLAETLPSLRTGEVIVSGDAVSLPVRAMIDPASPPPRASDPGVDGWSGEPRVNVVTGPIDRWRAEEAG